MTYRIEVTTPSAEYHVRNFLLSNGKKYDLAFGVASEGPAKTSKQFLVDSEYELMEKLQTELESIHATDHLWRGLLSQYTKIEKL